MTESAHRIDQMGRRGAIKRTSAGIRRRNFEDLKGITLANGWKVTEYSHSFNGHTAWKAEYSKGCGANTVGTKEVLKRHPPCTCEPPKVETGIDGILSRADYFEDGELGIPTPRSIIAATCEVYGVKPAQLSSASRNRSLVEGRQVAMYLMRHVLRMSYPEIGKLLLRHHTTVIHDVEGLIRKSGEISILHARLGAVAERLLKKTTPTHTESQL